jgi:acetyl-CoA carboxylase carboxyl transferase subunit beta
MAARQSENFLQCSNCKKALFKAEFDANLRVCPYCNWHERLSGEARIEATFDAGSFEELDGDLAPADPLSFPDYMTKVAFSTEKTGRKDSVIRGKAALSGFPVSVAVSDFQFMGGSMGSVSGEKIARTLETGAEEKMPVVIFCASGGARMQEGILSLMQMPKTIAAVHACREEGVPFVAVFTNPTMAGVLASYASVADVILAEPKSLVGFAGGRVSKQAQVSKVPDDFQTAEFGLRHGMIDKIVDRKELPTVLTNLVKLLGRKLNVK